MKDHSQLDLLILGLREPQDGMEKHFVKVMRAEARPASPLESEWYEYWEQNGERLRLEGFGNGRVEDYGICLDCGAEIPSARLAAIPGCCRCIACQTTLETVIDVRVKAEGNSFLGTPTDSNHGYSRDDS